MGDIVTFGVSLVPAGLCLIAAAIFKWAPYFSSKFDWTDYAILPLLLAGVAGLMSANIAGISLSGLLSGAVSRIYSGMSNAVPGLAWILAVAAASVITFFAVGHMIEGSVTKNAARQTAALPLVIAMIPAPIGTFLVAALGFVVSIPIFILGKLWGH